MKTRSIKINVFILIFLICPILANFSPKALGYQAPYSLQNTTLSTYQNGSQQYGICTITDPVTGQISTFNTPSLYGAPGGGTVYKYASGIQYFGHGYQDVFLTNEQHYIGFATYDPTQGQWKSYTSYRDNLLCSNFADGVGSYMSFLTNQAGYYLTLATYDPKLGDWAIKQVGLTGSPGINTYPYYGITSSGGMLFAWYSDSQSGDWVMCAIYDPTRQSWMTQKYAISRFDPAVTLSNGVITAPGRWQITYSFVSGAWVSSATSTPLSAFYVGKSYSSSYPYTRWVTDMSFGSSQTLNWGDGTTITAGGGSHNYASNQQWTITQSVSGWNNNSTTHSQTINQNTAPGASITVDGYASGAQILRPAGSSPTVTVHFSAVDADGNLSGIRYNAWNSTTGYFDNGGGGFTSTPGASGQVTKTFTLTDGVWYFWTDAQDTTNLYTSTGAWQSGFMITVTSDSPPVPTISVDGYSSGAQVHHNYGQNVTVTVHYNATDVDGNLSGIRYNIWNASSGYFDNSNSGFIAASGSSGQVTKTFTLSDDGDWYFWTDAEDSLNGYASTGAWTSGFKITLIQNGQPSLTPNPSALLVNLSVRGTVGTGNNTMIAGCVLSGGSAEPIFIKGNGPSFVPLGLDGILDPYIALYQGSSVIASNDDWQSAPNAAQISATGLAPTYSKESVIYQSLNPSIYTVMLNNHSTGTIGALEIDDLGGGAGAHLVNISGRAYVGTGNSVLIGGFIISGGPKKVLINGKGPSLTAMGVSGALTDPKITLYNSTGAIQSNNSWQAAWNASDIASTPYAPTDPHEASIYEVLPAGVYSIIVEGANSTTGVGLVEIYGL